uniref:Uncharacterized protein n=1 Tax=Renouxia sp. TaxID=2485823 RepID=A0A3G3MH72_9FLOR|nr:hypothetical protein [Renouxia sp.]
MKIKKKLIKEKIDILLISLESLDLYSFDDINKAESKSFKDLLNIFTIRQCNLLRDIETSAQCCFERSLLLINTIQQLVMKTHISRSINYILHDYCYSYKRNNRQNSSLLTKQYLNRFKYKYQKAYRYYQNKLINTKEKQLYNIAITHLYILHKACSREGLYILYKYIYVSTFLINF